MTGQDRVAGALTRVTGELGPDVLAHPQRLRAALSDVLGPSAREDRAAIEALCLAAEDGLGRAVWTAQATGPMSDEIVAVIGHRLVDQGISESLAILTIRRIAAALNRVGPSRPAAGQVPTLAPPVEIRRPDQSRPSADGARTRPHAPAPGPSWPTPSPASTRHPAGRPARRTWVIAAIAAAVLAVVATLGTWALRQGRDGRPLAGSGASTSAPIAPATTSPGGVTTDTARFQALDYAATRTPGVWNGTACVDSGAGLPPCSYWFLATNFGPQDVRVVAAKVVKGPGRAWIADNRVNYEVTRNGPYDVEIAVEARLGSYASTATLRLTVTCNDHFRCGGDFSS